MPVPITDGNETSRSALKKFEYLESLRGLASLSVVFAHFVVGFYPALYYAKAGAGHVPNLFEIMLSRTPLNLLYNGTFSVAIFFVLSGYVLTYKFFKDSGHEVALLPLAVKRYVRLLLPVLLSVGLSYVVLRMNWYYHQPKSLVGASNPWLVGLWNFEPNLLAMLKEGFYGVLINRDVTYNRVLWTMNIEFFGSLIVYLCVYLFRNSPKRYFFYLIGIALFLHAHYLAFMFGMILSDLTARQVGWFHKRSNQVFFMVVLAIGLFLGSYPDEIPVKGTIYSFLEGWLRTREYHILGAVFVMTALLKLPWLQSVLSRKPLVLLGKISFSLYLLHVIIMGSLGNHLFAAFSQLVSYHAAFAMTFTITLPVIFFASYLAYWYVDRSSVGAAQWAYDRTLGITKRVDRPLTDLVPTFLRRGNNKHIATQDDAPFVALSKGQGGKQEP